MLKKLALASALLCAFTFGAEARQRHSPVAQCNETGTVMRPVCGMVQPFSGARSLTVGRVKTVRVAGRRRATASSQHQEAFSQRLIAVGTASIGSGIVRSVSGATAHVAARATAAFQCFVTALDNQGYPVRFLGGWRAHGSVRGSLHPAGLAMDVNQVARNVTTPRMPSNEVALANGCGLTSGAQWASGDSGHVQLGGWAGGRRQHYASRRRHRHYASAAR